MGTGHHSRARWPRRGSREISAWRIGRAGRRGDGATNRWLTWVARIGATETWAAARVARYGGRFERRHGVAMRFVHPATLVIDRLPRGEQTVWRFTPQVHLALHPIVRQTLVHAAPVDRLPPDPTETAGRTAVVSARPTDVFVRREVVSTPARERSIAATDAVHPAAVPSQSVRSLQRAVYLHVTAPQYVRMNHSRSVLARRRVEQRVVTETVRAVIARATRSVEHIAAARSLQITQRVAEAGQRVEVPAAGRNVSLQTARPAVASPAAVDGVAHAPPSEALGTALHQPGRPGMGMETDLSPINVEQLTDQVVQAIDRRLLAHRERMGKLF